MSDTPLTDAAKEGGESWMELAALSARLERENAALKAALALGQENCDAEYERLREERDEAIAESAALREALSQAAKDEGALRRENVRLLEAVLHQSDLRADRDRLDWLDNYWWHGPAPIVCKKGESLRAAIDAAIKEEAQP